MLCQIHRVKKVINVDVMPFIKMRTAQRSLIQLESQAAFLDLCGWFSQYRCLPKQYPSRATQTDQIFIPHLVGLADMYCLQLSRLLKANMNSSTPKICTDLNIFIKSLLCCFNHIPNFKKRIIVFTVFRGCSRGVSAAEITTEVVKSLNRHALLNHLSSLQYIQSCGCCFIPKMNWITRKALIV